MLPCIRRALDPAQLQADEIRWGGFEPPPRGPHPRALPSELRTWKYRRRDSNSHGHVAHDVLRVARMHSATAAWMALARIELAARWSSPSRSTGELEEPLLPHEADGT